MIYLFNKNLELNYSVKKDDVIECTQVLELGGLITASATIKYSKDYESAFYFGVKEDNNFLIFKIRNRKIEKDNLIFDGIYIFFDDLKGHIIKDVRNQNYSTNLVLEKILANTGWTIGTNLATGVASKNFYYVSALEAFYEVVKIWSFEFKFRIEFKNGVIYRKYIDIYDNISKDNGKWYEYGDRLVSVIAESSTDELFTAFIGRGKGIPLEDENGNPTGGFSRKITFEDIEFSKDGYTKPIGQDYIEIKEATKAYGYPDGSAKFCTVDFDDIEDKKELAEATYKFALEKSRPKLQLKAVAQDENVELGETVAIIRPDINLRYKVRVNKIKKDLLTKKVIEYEFGDKIITSVGSRLKAELSEKRKRQEEINSYIDALRDEITASYFNDNAFNYELKIGNKYNLPAGYYSFDRPIDKEPTKVIYMGAGKILISNKKDSKGAWVWQTAGTGDGLVAESIVGNLGEFAKVNARQINVDDSFTSSPLAKKIVVQDELYNNVKISTSKGIQVIDNNNRERVQLGGLNNGRYGLKITDRSGTKTVVDDAGIMQVWQDSLVDNVDSSYPLSLKIYIPKETSRVYSAKLRIYTDRFRAYSKGNTTADTRYQTTASGGGDYASTTTDYDGDTVTSTRSGGGGTTTTYAEQYEPGRGHDHGIPRNTTWKDIRGWNVTWVPSGDHTHTVRIESHDHDISLPSHNHRVQIRIPSHSHDYVIPAHSHEIIYGIYVANNNPSYYIRINGTDRTHEISGQNSFSGTIDNAEIGYYLNIGAWNTIDISANGLGRVNASIFVQALINYGG